MYDILIKNYVNASGTYTTGEDLMYSVPFAPNADIMRSLADPVVKMEMGKTGTFEFTIYPTQPFYESWRHMKTIMRVKYEGDTIFRGRLLTIDTNLKGDKKLHFEGDLAFLMDSMQEATKEEDRPEIGISAYLQQVIASHNSQMAQEPDKQFTLGWVPGNYPQSITDDQRVNETVTARFGTSSYQSTMDTLEGLRKEYGGYFRTRYVENQNGTDICYLDWLDNWFQDVEEDTQPIEIGINLLELSSSNEVDNIFTVCIPIGSDESRDVFLSPRTIYVPDLLNKYSREELSRGFHDASDYENAISQYGIIYRVQSFPNANTVEKLEAYAYDWVKNNYVGGLVSLNVTAVDMHHLDPTKRKYLCGDRVPIRYPNMAKPEGDPERMIDKNIAMTTIEYRLSNPEKNSYSLGIPNNILNRTYGTKNKKLTDSTANTGGGGGGGGGDVGGGGGGGGGMHDPNDRKITWPEVQKRVMRAYGDYIDADALYRSFEIDHPELFSGTEKPLIPTFTIACATNGVYSVYGDTEHPERYDKICHTMLFDGLKGQIKIYENLPETITGSMAYPQDRKKVMDELVANPLYAEKAHIITQRACFGTLADEENGIGIYRTIKMSLPRTPEEWHEVWLDSQPWSLRKKAMYELKQEAEAKGGTVFAQFWSQDRDTNPLAKPTITNLGKNGLTGQVYSSVGKDGTGDLSVFFQNGLSGIMSMDSLLDPGTPETAEAKAQITVDSTEATQNMGKVSSSNWKVKLNDTVSYTDKDGNTQTVKGFVSAEDFKIKDTTPSMKTKLLVVDNLVAGSISAGQINAGEISALKGRISTIEANYITADYIKSGISISGDVGCTRLTCASGACAGQFTAGSLVLFGKDWRTIKYVKSVDFVLEQVETGSVTVLC